jgi:hypothetical protein
LSRVQQADLDSMGQHRVDEMLMSNQSNALARVLSKFPLSEVQYYIKFAVAAYGDNGIKSANLDLTQTFDWRSGDWTTARVSEHTGIPEEDLKLMDVAYHNDPKQLRHFVAIDRKNYKVVLAIRGTYTQKEVMIDFNGYSREFLVGEAHAAMAIMSERLWEKIGDEVIQFLDDHPGYELIVTGHSLGGGSTCLLNLILHNDPRIQGRKFRAFAFASPPVYVPLSQVSAAAQTCVNIINQYNGVPFLSGDTVRHQMAMITAVDKWSTDLQNTYSYDRLLERAKLLLGLEVPDPELVQQIHDIQRRPLPFAKVGVPHGMSVPAIGNIWIWPTTDMTKDEAPYKAVIGDSSKMSDTGIFIHKNDFTDHLPARYEYVLNHVSSAY